MSITENGYGKRTSVEDYRRTGRGGQGVANIETSDRNGLVVASFTVFAEDQLMLVTDAGKVIRIRVDGGEGDTIRVAGRKTQGVRLFEVDGSEKVVSVGVIRDADTDDEEEEGEGAELAPMIIRYIIETPHQMPHQAQAIVQRRRHQMMRGHHDPNGQQPYRLISWHL